MKAIEWYFFALQKNVDHAIQRDDDATSSLDGKEAANGITSLQPTNIPLENVQRFFSLKRQSEIILYRLF